MTEPAVDETKIVIPQSYRDATKAQELDVSVWQKIFEITGETESLGLNGSEPSHKQIIDFLSSGQSVSQSLYYAIKTIYDLGDEDGREIIACAAKDVSVDLTLEDTESSRELAARLWLMSLNNEKIESALVRAIAIFQFSQKSVSANESAGPSSFELIEPDREKIKEQISTWCVEQRKSNVVQVYTYSIEGTWCCDVIRGDPIKVIAIIDGNRQSSIRITPAATDHIQVEPDTGRIKIVTRSNSFISAYRNIMGELLTGEANFFSTNKLYSLEPLRLQGRQLLENNLTHQIRKVTLRSLTWQPNAHGCVVVTGRDCFKLLEDINTKLEIGELTKASLDFEISGVNRAKRVDIVVPDRSKIPPDEYELVISRYLESIGLKGRFEDVENRPNLWSINPWVLNESDWKEVIGEGFHHLFAAGIMLPVELGSVTNPENTSQKQKLQVGMLDNQTLVGIGIDPKVKIRTLSDDDVQGFRLDLHALCVHLANLLALSSNVQEVDNGVWTIGQRMVGTKLCSVFFASQTPAKNTRAVLKECANGGEFLLIVPKGCTANIGVPLADCNIAHPEECNFKLRVYSALGVARAVDPREIYDEDLIVDDSNKKVFLFKQELDINPDSHQYDLIRILVQANNEYVSQEELNRDLSESDETGTAKTAKFKFLKAAKQKIPELCDPSKKEAVIRSVTNVGYRVNCTAVLIP